MRSATKALALRALLAAGILGGAAAFGAISFASDAGKTFLFCPQLHFTGLYCPGCGTMRALNALLHGRIGAAFAANPLSTLLLPVLAALGLWWLAGFVLTGRDQVFWRIPARVYYAVLAALLLFGILRNMPLPVFDCLRPIA